tara:strand:+ start:3957 stop:5048 length:1092 start_codon:yes stop_codon:yes gene_type:complete
MITINTIDRIEFNITSLCNAACPMCIRTIVGDKLELNSLPYETYKDLLDQLPRSVDIDFCGTTGDAIMHPDILRIVELMAEQERGGNISTNAGAKSTELFTKLGKLSAQSNKKIRFEFAIDGLEDTHALYRIDTNYNKVMENARAFIDAGGYAIWQYIIFQHNEHQLEEAKNLATEYGFRKFKHIYSKRFKLPNIEVDAKSYSKKINKNQSTKEKGFTLTVADQVPQKIVAHREKTVEQLLQEQNNDISCRTFEKNELFVDEKGRVWPCCFWHGESQAPKGSGLFRAETTGFTSFYEELIGKVGEDWNSLHHHTLQDILQSYVFQEFLPQSLDHKLPKCGTCIAKCTRDKMMINRAHAVNSKL